MNQNDQIYEEAFARNKGLISDEDQQKLKNARVAIAGLGAVGGSYVTTMARLGVGKINIADLDIFERVNRNRQAGAFESTIGQPKTSVMEKMAKDIYPGMDVRIFDKGITPENIDEFLDGVDVVLDGIDFFQFDARQMLYRKARERNLAVVGSAPLGFGSSTITFGPSGISFDEYFDITDKLTPEEKLLKFGMGMGPSLLQRSYYPVKVVNFKDHAAPSSILSIVLAANLTGTQAFKILTGKEYTTAPTTIHFDPYVQQLRTVVLKKGNGSFIQRLKFWYVKKYLLSK